MYLSLNAVAALKPNLQDAYAAVFAELRSNLIASAELEGEDKLTIEQIRSITADFIPPALEKNRRYQELQSLINCTRLSLLPGTITQDTIEATRNQWAREIADLEAQGVR